MNFEVLVTRRKVLVKTTKYVCVLFSRKRGLLDGFFHHLCQPFRVRMMRCVQVNTDGAGSKESAERNHHSRDEHKGIRGSCVGEGHGLSEEDESRINEAENMNDRHEVVVWADVALQRQLQQSPLPPPPPPPPPPLPSPPSLHQQRQNPSGPIVRWERFLPLRSLKVLLVENDDSTRQVVSALLRNCSYEGET